MSYEKHILLIPSWYPEKAGDINGSFFREQAVALQKAGNKVGVIKPTVRSIKDVKGVFCKPYGVRFENDLGVNTYRLHALNLTPRMPVLSKDRWVRLGEKLYLKYMLKHGKPDVIHVHSLMPGGFLAEKLKRKYNIPFVVTEHSSGFARNLISQERLNQIRGAVDASSYRIAVSKDFKSVLSEKFLGSIWDYIPNIVNDDFLNTTLSNKKNSEYSFVNICYLTENKNVDFLIKSFAKAFKGDSYVKLKIGGDGEEKENLVKLAKKLGVDQQVIFLGQLTRENVIKEILSSDAFVLSSEYETFGVVLVEALALGKPVIATKCGGPESIVTPEVGYLVDKNSEKQLSEAMQVLIKNRDNFKPEGIRRYCQECFSEKAVVEKLNEVYESVLASSEK